MQKIKILAISGSLRANSSTQVVMNAARSFVPEGIEFNVSNYPGRLPHFNDSADVPVEVEEFRSQLREADGVLFVTPEYAFGLPGTLKNALDWTVSSGELVNKPVGVIVAATGGENAYHSLLLILKALSSNVSEESKLLISFIRAKMNKEGSISDTELLTNLSKVLSALTENISKQA
jgi:chromate reductase, NAD(P)H dehydrogenase (quinone)